MDAEVPEQLHELVMDLVRFAGLLQLEQEIPGHAVSLSQAFALHQMAAADAPLAQRDLAERLRLEKSTVSRMVADLERKGHLTRERDPANRRVHRLRLTGQGRDLHVHLASAFHQHYVRWVSAMAPAERDALLVGLPALVRAMHHDREHEHRERDHHH